MEDNVWRKLSVYKEPQTGLSSQSFPLANEIEKSQIAGPPKQ